MAKTYFSLEGCMPPEAFERIHKKFADKYFIDEFSYENNKRHFSISGIYWAYSVVKQFLEDFAVCLKKQKLDDVYICRLNKGFDSEIWAISKHGIKCFDMHDVIQHAIAQIQETAFAARNMAPLDHLPATKHAVALDHPTHRIDLVVGPHDIEREIKNHVTVEEEIVRWKVKIITL